VRLEHATGALAAVLPVREPQDLVIAAGIGQQ
jgi:hypothetical protein